ncbi:MAG: gamma-glutamyltransferase, partial [Longimicrobiales bacterium]
MTRSLRTLASTVGLSLGIWGCTAPVPDSADVTFPSSWRYAATEQPIEASNGMVVSTDEYASQVGVDVLRSGGNAIDAAIAVQFALAVVNPEAGNIGGGGFMVLRTAG